MSQPGRSRDPLPTRVEDTPALPSAYAVVLERGLLELGLILSDAARAAIDGHARLLLSWTTAINLTSIREPATAARLHVLDSLAGVTVVGGGDLGAPHPGRLLDLGSGGGYPGLTLAAALSGSDVVLADSIAKKVRFLETVIHATGLGPRVEAIADRAENLAADPRHRSAYDVVVARAVGDLADLAELALPLLAVGGRLIAWKRGDIDAEVAAAERTLTALGGGDIERTPVRLAGLDDHVLVVVRKDAATPAGFPRDPATRRRRPL